MLSSQAIDIVIKNLDTLTGVFENIEADLKQNKVSITYRDDFGNLHRSVIKCDSETIAITGVESSKTH